MGAAVIWWLYAFTENRLRSAPSQQNSIHHQVQVGRKLGLWLRLECSLDCIIYVSEGFDVPRDYRSRRGRETIKRYDVTETYSHVVRQNLSETSITCAESC